METIQPGDRSRLPARRRVAAYVLAVVLPLLTAVAMIPFRVDHGRVAVLVLVLPVVVVALLGAVGPAIVAAITAVLAYDLFLAEPYYSLPIDDPDEIVAAVTLFAVALVVGVLNARLVRLRARESARRDELQHLVAFSRVVIGERDPEVLVGAACGSLTSVLDLQHCEWQPGVSESTRPMLLPDGNLMGRIIDFNADRATLPDPLEIPGWVDGAMFGRFVVTPKHGHVVSYEERITAATIAQLFCRVAASTQAT